MEAEKQIDVSSIARDLLENPEKIEIYAQTTRAFRDLIEKATEEYAETLRKLFTTYALESAVTHTGIVLSVSSGAKDVTPDTLCVLGSPKGVEVSIENIIKTVQEARNAG